MSRNKYYPETQSSPNFPEVEEKILKNWEADATFEKSIDIRPAKTESGKNNEYIFYDGPPFANGLPHYGHLLTSCVKDIFARYHTMKGEKVERRFGWDCHGLPAEMGAEKEIGVSGRAAIEKFGIDNFNDHCRTSVMKYTDIWQDYINRAGRWVDFEHDYKTMDQDYMESVIWGFKQLYDKGLVYESHRVMPYSWAAETPLSNFETRMDDAYRDRTDKAVTVAFKLKEVPEVSTIIPLTRNPIKILAWTTTPWTLPSNLALAVSPDISYTILSGKNDTVIIATNSGHLYAEELKYYDGEPIYIKGSDLLNLSYEPLFPYFADTPNAFRILDGSDFIEEGSGTGVVHLAPGFGEDDQRVCAKNGIEIVCPVDEAGRFTDEIFDINFKTKNGDDAVLRLAGLNVIAETVPQTDFEKSREKQVAKYGLANFRIANYLGAKGVLIKSEDYTHSYPHCWRTDKPLIYKAMPSWYIEVTKFRDRMVELNQNINWIPSHIRDGQFGKWLEGARDWSISRNRFWGCPIPIWRTESGKIKAFGSITELEEFFGVDVPDLHKPFIDTLTKEENGETWRRVPDVFDCWFESGSMPFAQVHYPFENEEWFESHSPADFIVEYVGQTRGWFYTLMVLSTALFDREPFKNCICHGVILDTTGKKLSKKLRNYPDPREIFDKYGADAMRWRMIKEPVMHGGNLLISQDGNDIRDVVRLSIKPIWNAYHFFCLYANTDEIQAKYTTVSDNLMDRYILAKLKQSVEAIETSLDGYDTPNACTAVDDFFEVLNNWYIRRNRDRFWREATDNDCDKQAAYDTLYTVLITMCSAAAPLLPLITEEIYQGLTQRSDVRDQISETSVHLVDFPDVSGIDEEKVLIMQMERVRNICNTALAIRDTENIRTRQPINKVKIYGETDGLKDVEQLCHMILDEINVKTINFIANVFSGDSNSIASLKLQINFPVAGKRLGAKMKEVSAAARKGEWEKLSSSSPESCKDSRAIHKSSIDSPRIASDSGNDERVEVAGEILELNEFSIKLEPKKGTKGAQALSTNDALVMLDLEITPELKAEGLARDIVRFIQQSRKDADLNVADRINLVIEADQEIQAAVIANKAYVMEQTLTLSLNFGNVLAEKYISESSIEDRNLIIGFSTG